MDVSSELHAPAGLTPGKIRPYPLDRRLDGPQSGLDVVVKRQLAAPRRESKAVHLLLA
jgi:hypothetical protein